MDTTPGQDDAMPVALSIAGSDSSGGAGIQADLKTFSVLGVYGTTALTCITAQNPGGVSGIRVLDPDFIGDQIRAVCEAYPVLVAKTGMLYDAEIIRSVAGAIVREGIPTLVVDPVMVAASGAKLLRDDAIEALCTTLLPQARVITPNTHEAEILCGHAIRTEQDLRDAAREIGDRFDIACLAKGGHLEGEEVIDVLYDEGSETIFRMPRLRDAETHGAGCTFSAALTAYLAQGDLLEDAADKAKGFVHEALAQATRAGRYRPLNFFWTADDEPVS